MASLSVGQNPCWNLYQTSWKQNVSILETILKTLETILGNLSRSSVCDVIRQAGTQYMLPPATLPHSLASHKHSTPRNKELKPKHVEVFRNSAVGHSHHSQCSRCSEMDPKSAQKAPDILHAACKRRYALGAHDHATACQMFAAFALAFRRSWGMESCWYEGLPDPLFPTSHACSVFLSCFRQEGSSYWKTRKCQNMPAIRTNPVSQEPFGTVPDRS